MTFRSLLTTGLLSESAELAHLLLILMGAALLAYGFWPQPKKPTAAQLYELAMNGATQQEREKAVFDLAKLDIDGKAYLRMLIKPAMPSGAREAAVLGLGECRDFQSMPALLDLLDDPSEQIRARAGMSVSVILGRGFPFDASKSAEERANVIAFIRRDYEAMKKSQPPMYRQ